VFSQEGSYENDVGTRQYGKCLADFLIKNLKLGMAIFLFIFLSEFTPNNTNEILKID